MNQLPSPASDSHSPSWRRTFDLGIRGKVTFPYLILTLAVAFVGVFIVTRFVTDSLAERFDNQLIDAGQVAADSLVRIERKHLELWRLLAATDGLAQAVRDGDSFQARERMLGQAANQAIDSVWAIRPDNTPLVTLYRKPDGQYDTSVSPPIEWEPLARALRGERDQFGDKFAGMLYQTGQPYIFTVGPIYIGDQLAGALMVGTRLDNALKKIREEAVAEISVYDLDGNLLGSTLPPPEPNDPENRLSVDQVNDIIARSLPGGPNTPGQTLRLPLKRGSAEYTLAYGAFQIRQDVLGVYSIALESNFIVSSTVTSRLLFALIFGVMVVAVFATGLLISQRLISPIMRLVSTSQAVAGGNLNQRTGLTGADEIGRLAATFDNMTQKLQERTRDLEHLLQAHREEALKTRAILASIADGVLVLDPRGQIIMMNQAAEHILGDMAQDFSLGMLREKPIEAIEPKPESFLDSLQTDDVRRFEINQSVISAHSAPVITDDGQKLGTVVVLRDITREAEVDRLKDSFIEQVSHELRTPLTAVKGYSDLMLQTAVDDMPAKYLEFMNIINRHADSLVTMITELLDITQIEAKSMSLRLERIDLNELIGVTINEWRERIAEKGLTLVVTLDPNSGALTGDRRRLGWAIKQLVSNAYHYTDPGGRVEVAVSSDDDRATIKVTDTGIGITPEDMKYLFTRFFRSTSRMHSNERGVGLGLYIVKAVVTAHRGTVEVSSRPGEGSTFTVRLPVQEEEGEPPLLQMLQENRT